MKINFDKLNKLTLPITIIVASLILGSFYYATQVNKQKSIEKQQQIELEAERQEQLTKELKEQKAKEEAKQALNTCITNAEEKASYHNQQLLDFAETSGNTESGKYNLEGAFDSIKDELAQDKANCFKQYPQ